VCVTIAQGSRPVCTYTASLVARDVERDIALLRVDVTDIFDKTVQLSQLPPLSLAFDYLPTSQDKVVAIGYPWIGADTITETV
jgi:S1-C subfamily serine protease